MMQNIKKKGFTLVELMVAVGLMVILIGAVVAVFVQSSEVMSTSEAQMAIYQNARAIFDRMARDLASVQVTDNDSDPPAENISNPNNRVFVIWPTSSIFLRFVTIGSWWEGGTAKSGMVRVAYSLESKGSHLWVLKRSLYKMDQDSPFNNEILGQYVYGEENPHLTVEYFTYNSSTHQFEVKSGSKTFDGDETNHLPSSIRITMDLSDRKKKAIRSVSRILWIATGTQ